MKYTQKVLPFESVEIEEQIPAAVFMSLTMCAYVALCAVVKLFYMKSKFILQNVLNRNDDFHVRIVRAPCAYNITKGNPTCKWTETSAH